MPELGRVTPVLRIMDEAKAREFYIDFLGFKSEFEHRFGDNFPVYMGISHSDCYIHLSEHYGDIVAGANVRIQIKDLDGYSKYLRDKDYKYAKPGKGEKTPWGSYELTITDPFGNKLTFVENIEE